MFAEVVDETLQCQASCNMLECLKATFTLWLLTLTIFKFIFGKKTSSENPMCDTVLAPNSVLTNLETS